MSKNKENKNQRKKVTLKEFVKERFLFLIGVINIGLLVINILVIYFIPKKTEQIITTRSEILAQKLQSQSAQKIITDLQAIDEQRKKLETSLPNKEMLLDVIKLIESLADIVEIESFSFESEQPIEGKEGFSYLPLTLIINGDFPNTMVALSRIQSSSYLFSVSHTLIESPEGLSQVVKVRTALRIYVRQPFVEN